MQYRKRMQSHLQANASKCSSVDAAIFSLHLAGISSILNKHKSVLAFAIYTYVGNTCIQMRSSIAHLI